MNNNIFNQNPAYAKIIQEGIGELVTETISTIFSMGSNISSQETHTESVTGDITVLLPGFAASDLDIEVVNNVLTVKAMPSDIVDTVKPVTKQYNLADGLEVSEANMINGVLTIKFKNNQSASKIKINS